ncbi:MAG: hypothetical protein ACK50B_05890 [Betaproteobacteria bacterium]|jgi:hypothetical protein
MNAIHHDINTLTEAANSKSTAAASSVLGTTQPLAELPLVQLEMVGGGFGATSFY